MSNLMSVLLKITILTSYIVYILLFNTNNNSVLSFYNDYTNVKRNFITNSFVEEINNLKKQYTINTVSKKDNINYNAITWKTIFLIDSKYSNTSNNINYINSVNFYPLHIMMCSHFMFRNVCLDIQ